MGPLSYYIMPYNSWTDVVRLMVEWYDTNFKRKLSGFRSKLLAFNVSKHTELLWYKRNSLFVDKNMHIYIYIYMYENISFQTIFRMDTFIDSTHMKL